MIELLDICCMEYMKTQPDNAFDLAIVDPEYGNNKGKNAPSRIRKDMDKANDNPPDEKYFNELFRVSKNQIIWGGNYFKLPPSRGFIFWYKHQPVNTYADGEFAWTSFDRNCKCFDYPFFGCHGIDKDGKIHPTQKPIVLYNWLLEAYAEKGQRILDTHLGSASSAIAAHYFGVDFVGCEIEGDFYKAAKERFDRETKQIAMF